MKEVGDLEELRMEYAEKDLDDFKRMEHRRAQETYPGTHYRTVEEFFLQLDGALQGQTVYSADLQ